MPYDLTGRKDGYCMGELSKLPNIGKAVPEKEYVQLR